jgi:hypothetical protein
MNLIHLSISVTAINLALLAGCAAGAETRADGSVNQDNGEGWSTAAPAGINQDTSLGEASQEIRSRDAEFRCMRQCNEMKCECEGLVGGSRGACYRSCQRERRECLQNCRR